MQKTLHALIELQEVDNRLDELMEERGDLPHIVHELEEKLNLKKEDKAKYDDEILNFRNRLKELENLLIENTDKLEKYNNQLYQVKTNREYDAITNEIEVVQIALKEHENEKETITLSIEENVLLVSEIETSLSGIEEELSENKIELASRTSETKEEEDKLLKEREAILTNLKPGVLKTYESVRGARSGKGIAEVLNGNCGGCFSYIPPQKIVEVRKMKKIYECEFCGRILVWNEKVEN